MSPGRGLGQPWQRTVGETVFGGKGRVGEEGGWPGWRPFLEGARGQRQRHLSARQSRLQLSQHPVVAGPGMAAASLHPPRRDDPYILAWSIANEPRYPDDPSGAGLTRWIAEAAAFVKSIDSNHLVAVDVEGFFIHGTPGATSFAVCWERGLGVERLRPWHRSLLKRELRPNRTWQRRH